MKFTVQFKDPDGPYNCIQHKAEESLKRTEGIDEEEMDVLVEERAKKMREFTNRWIKWGEYVSIEFDTDAGTARVLPAN